MSPINIITIVVLCSLSSVSCQFSKVLHDLVPSQQSALQQQLQLRQTALEHQLNELERQFQVNQQNGVVFESLINQRNKLQQDIALIQSQLFQLKQDLSQQNQKSRNPDDSLVPVPQLVKNDQDDNLFLKQKNLAQDIRFLDALQAPPTSFADPFTNIPTFPKNDIFAVPSLDDDLPCVSTVGSGFCKPLIRCLAFYADIPELRRQPCQFRGGELGICCPAQDRLSGFPTAKRTGVLVPPPPPRVIVPAFTPQQINRSITIALEKLQDRKSLVSNLFSQRILVPTGTAAAWHQELFPTSNETLEIGEGAQKSVEASVELVNDFNLSREQGAFGLPKFSILNTVLADTCPKKAFCRAHKYRATDGSCNNLNHQQWGSPGTALQRILPPKYGDGVNSPRTHSDKGVPLPSVRLVSSSLAQDRDTPSDNYTLLLMQYGQFVDHDITHTPISRGQSGFGISCCRNGKPIEASLRHPDCFAIEMPSNDHMFSKFGEQCMEFVRSLPAPRPECNFGPREQMNQITGYLDGSAMYASSLDVQRGLRQLQGGKLRAQNFRGKSLLPANPSECSDETQNLACFTAGDGRVNEGVELALIHTIMLREHNRIATVLAQQHPNWSDEAVFQETRRIVIAEIQHITYNEYLPIILGSQYVDTFQLKSKNSGWTNLYDPNLNAGITNVFATAAYRFGHTLIPSNIHGYGKFGNIRENLQLSKQHFAPFSLYKESGIDDFIRGFSFQSCQMADRFFSREITDHLFQGNLNFGLDLVSLNLQRGRDHGLPPYNDWREVCGLDRAKSWNDLEDMMDVETIERLASLYDSVDEVDLYVGGVSEKPAAGALLGPTFVCLIGDQFSRLRRGDRFFYEEGGQLSSFSEAQLRELRKASLARILCDNSDNLVVMQPLAFFKPSLLNQRVPCDSQAIPRVDLRAWVNEVPAVP
ncbi:peroxidase-like [Planococcus citri]|uniref:peroxidase-like n=1 Tax=Planococcus citri TaxID=170843 RepID=UPI0031F97A21